MGRYVGLHRRHRDTGHRRRAHVDGPVDDHERSADLSRAKSCWRGRGGGGVGACGTRVRKLRRALAPVRVLEALVGSPVSVTVRPNCVRHVRLQEAKDGQRW